MKIRLKLDENTPAGKLGLELVAVRQQIDSAVRDEMPAEVIAALRERERVLSNEVVTTLAESGSLLDAMVGR